MTTENNPLGIPVRASTEVHAPVYRTLSWRAIIAGTVAGLAVHILLTLLGLGLGIASLEPISDANPIAKLGLGAAIAWCVSALIALWVGGWVAGHFSPTGYKCSGGLHGFLVWSLATVAVLLFATSTVGFLIGGAAGIVGAAAKPVAAAASGATDLAKEAIKQNTDAIGSYVEEALQSVDEKVPGGVVRAKREIGYALAKLFGPGGDINSQESRAAVTRALTAAGVNQEQADRMLNEWTAAYERMKADLKSMMDTAEVKAREAGEAASKATSRAAVWTFLAFLIGAIVASLAGKVGACRNDDDTAGVVTRRRV